jgi:glycerol kinase
MASSKYILSIDQGTSSTKTLIFDATGKAIAKGSIPLQTNYFNDGFVEQDPQGIYENVLASVTACLSDFMAQGLDKTDIVSIGISNQRETFVVWDSTGKPLHNAVVWQCKRSVQICAELEARGLAQEVNEKTGLIIDPYFSATKLIWLKENNPTIAAAIQNGSAYFGTIDTWILYQLTNGSCYATDYTNASRTLLFNLHSLQWDAALIDQFGLSNIQLPIIQASSSYFGTTTINGLLPNSTAIHAMIGDSHAAAFGEACFTPGTAKATLGTGCSILMNVGNAPALSKNGMISTICWSTEDQIQYALEGVIVSCGSTIEWIKNELHLFSNSSETSAMANSVADNGGVYVIPSFSGLGSPHWQMDRKASINGLHFGANKNHIVRAALESIPYQIKDVIIAMEQDARVTLTHLNVDGGITNNAFVMSFLAGLLQKEIATVQLADVSALGAALLAGLKAAIFTSIKNIAELDLGKKIIPASTENTYDAYYEQWTSYIKS